VLILSRSSSCWAIGLSGRDPSCPAVGDVIEHARRRAVDSTVNELSAEETP
jgi:hypothetical protein